MAQDGSQPNARGARGLTATPRSTGTLYIVSTPIGHPDDITLRALATLRRDIVVAAENPRSTQALLVHHGITATVTSYGPSNLHEKVQILLHRLLQGQDVALVSDNGTPVIYDPGSLFVAAAHQAGIPVKAIPGPSTITAAVAISGFSGDAIIFEGHLPVPLTEEYDSVTAVATDPNFNAYANLPRRWQQQVDQIGRMAGDEGDGRFYYTGMAQAFLLDQLLPDWKTMALDEGVYLEDLLAIAINNNS
jgi:16S rRNA (cytidine(1402)-2'-O)-methyltransferase